MYFANLPRYHEQETNAAWLRLLEVPIVMREDKSFNPCKTNQMSLHPIILASRHCSLDEESSRADLKSFITVKQHLSSLDQSLLTAILSSLATAILVVRRQRYIRCSKNRSGRAGVQSQTSLSFPLLALSEY